MIGAGIGGLTAALSLHEIGAHVEVFEAAPSLEPIGVGINLLPHAVRELDALGLLDHLTERAVLPETLVYCTRRGQEIWSEPRGRAAQYRWPQVSTHRGVLQEVLLDAFLQRVGERHLHLNRPLSHIEEAGDRPAARFGHEVAEADLIVAADGIHSVARRQRYPDEGPPLWNGSLMWRGLAEVERVLDGRTMIWAGHPDQKFVGYPIADLADGRQSFNFIAELRRPGSGLAADEDWNRTGRFEDFLPQFLDWNFGWLDVPAIIKAAPETYLYPMVDREPLPRWTFGRTTLLGDAAHPMYPIGSNGASQAILDARVLAGCLRRHPRNRRRPRQVRGRATAGDSRDRRRQPGNGTGTADGARRRASSRRFRADRRRDQQSRDRGGDGGVPSDRRLRSVVASGRSEIAQRSVGERER